ncbi:MAG TPA: DUF5317 domain-containing protein [Anaerolineales bacterium]
MILLSGIVGGLLAGWAWARWRRKPYQAPALQSAWLIPVGFIPQFIVAYLPATYSRAPSWLAAVSIFASLIVFLAFVWENRRLPGMLFLLAGLLLNLSVMAANRGWMPISSDVASRLIGGDVSRYVALGERFGPKDILLSPQDMHLGFLADRFLLPAWSPYQVAFSAGDILIAIGVFWLLARPPVKVNPMDAE